MGSDGLDKQVQRRSTTATDAARQHQICLQGPLALVVPEADRQLEDQPQGRVCSDGPTISAHKSRERGQEGWCEGWGGDIESGTGGEFGLVGQMEKGCGWRSLTLMSMQYLYFPCGIIRGALAGLGMDVTVHADSSEIPAATFQIKTRGAKA